MSWTAEVRTGELRPWPDAVRVVRGNTEEERKYVPETPRCKMALDDLREANSRMEMWQSIAKTRHDKCVSLKETNADLRMMLEERTCKAIKDDSYYKGIHGHCQSLRCSNCREPLFSEFRCCPWCGARIEEEAE